jgi:hypothetical protein
MGGYTPGPWTYQPACNYVGYSISPRGTLPTLAAVERPVGGELLTIEAFNFPGETEANARLIAAAPEMFEALDHISGLCRALRSGGPDPMDLQELSDALHEAVDMANAAISRATGEGQA